MSIVENIKEQFHIYKVTYHSKAFFFVDNATAMILMSSKDTKTIISDGRGKRMIPSSAVADISWDREETLKRWKERTDITEHHFYELDEKSRGIIKSAALARKEVVKQLSY